MSFIGSIWHILFVHTHTVVPRIFSPLEKGVGMRLGTRVSYYFTGAVCWVWNLLPFFSSSAIILLHVCSVLTIHMHFHVRVHVHVYTTQWLHVHMKHSHIGSTEHISSLAQGVFACIVGLYSAILLVGTVNVWLRSSVSVLSSDVRDTV